MRPNYPGTKLVPTAFKLTKKMKTSPSCVHVLQITLTKNVPKHTTHVQNDCFCSLNLLFVAFSLPSSLLKFPTKAVTTATPTKTSHKWLTFTLHVSKEVSQPWTKLTSNHWSRYHKFLWCQISKYQFTENLQNQKGIGYTDANSKTNTEEHEKFKKRKTSRDSQSSRCLQLITDLTAIPIK